jgi:altronate hydrolase
MTTKALKIHPDDNIMVALSDLQQGETVTIEDEVYTIKESIRAKHKFAIRDIQAHEPVFMYGMVIGKTKIPVKKGELISTFNTIHATAEYLIKESKYNWKAPDVSRFKSKVFMGYKRSDGQVGTRNYWIVVPLVFCENRNVEFIKNAFNKRLGYTRVDKYEGFVEKLIGLYKQESLQSFNSVEVEVGFEQENKEQQLFENVDGIKFLTHTGGCGGTREDSNNLIRIIAGYINNPNVAGATILSLGCQNAQIDMLKNRLQKINPVNDKPVLFYEQQKYPTEDALLKEAIFNTFRGLTEINKVSREPFDLSKLCIGLKCGGSDGFSGITANPAMGYVSDIISALGGKTILAEFPELCGVEQTLIDRCLNTKDAQKFVELMSSYNKTAEQVGSGFSMNPSPGNIKDGLVTDAMKSAGAAKKGGSSPITGVLDYGEYVKQAGLNLLCTPGNDVEATTGMAGSGANIIIFSTGLGTPTGNPITPVVKTSTNSILNQRMNYIIDFNHGDIITNGKSIEQSGSELLDNIIEIASGKVYTKAEDLQQDDFIPWKKGVSL